MIHNTQPCNVCRGGAGHTKHGFWYIDTLNSICRTVGQSAKLAVLNNGALVIVRVNMLTTVQ